MSPRLRRPFAALLALAAAVALAGCQGPSVPMEPAAYAAAPECADVSVRLPDTVDGLELRATNAQATGAWGTPATVLLRCGVETPGPSTERCVSLDGVDWIEDASRGTTYVYTTFGRTPAVEVWIDTSVNQEISGTAVLMDLKNAVETLPDTGGCLGADDLFGVPGDDPSATPPATAPAPSAPAPTERP